MRVMADVYAGKTDGAEHHARSRAAAAVRTAIIALCAMTLLSLTLTYVSAVDTQTGAPLSYTGLQMIGKVTGGKSNGAVHPMIITQITAVAALAVSLIFYRSAFLPCLASGAALAALLMFRFDMVFAEAREFGFTEGLTASGAGWYIAAASMGVAFASAVGLSVYAARRKRYTERARIFTNEALPAGYKPLSLPAIIARDFKKHWPVYLMILPTLVYYIMWCYGPMYGIVIAFNNFSPRRGFWGSEWAGFKWFREFFRSPFAARTIRNTLMINVLNLLIGFPAPIIFALMINEMRSIAYKRVVQTVAYIPHFISIVVLSGLMIDFLGTEGVVTNILGLFGFPKNNLLGQARYFRSVYIVSEIWQHLGWNSIIFLSALAAISMELYEAAIIDGAGKMRQMWHVTLPGIAPTITILLILQIGRMMTVGYEKIILLYNAIIYDTADVVSTYVYRVGIENAEFSRSTAVGLFNSLINFSLVIMANRISGMITETSLW